MKRARVTTRSEAARARARVPPVSPDALLALLDDADVTVGQMCACTSALASLTADLAARKDESLQLAVAQVASARSALLSCKTRVLGLAKRLLRKQCKIIFAAFEAMDASTEQLHVWAGVARTGAVCPDLNCVFAASPLLEPPRRLQSPATGVSSMNGLQSVGELGSVVIGDGLRVVSAAGPGLKWFEPHSRNEFSVVFAHSDGSVPVWLTTGDVTVAVLSSVASTAIGTAVSNFCADGSVTVSVVYGGLRDDALEASLQLTVCGGDVSDASSVCGNRRLRVPRKPLSGHQCSAVGTHVCTLAVVDDGYYTLGIAVNVDEQWMVVAPVGLCDKGTLSVYSLPGGELVRTFGGEGDGPLQFNGLGRMCFAPNGNIIVVDEGNRRLQEVTMEGVFMRFIGVGEFIECRPFCVDVHDDVIAVGCQKGTGSRVVLFDFGTGLVTLLFGDVGAAPGQLSRTCTGIRVTHAGSHVIVAEDQAERLSLFTTAGLFVRCVGVGVLGGYSMDVMQSVAREYVVTDTLNQRVCVFSPDGLELVRSWGVEGAGGRQLQRPTALAFAGQHFYVMVGCRVQVFE